MSAKKKVEENKIMLLQLQTSVIPSLSKSVIKRISEDSIIYKFMKELHLDYIFPRTAEFWEEIQKDKNKMKQLQPRIEYLDLHEFLVRKIKGFLKSEFNIPKDSYQILDIKINNCPQILIGHLQIGGIEREQELVLYEYLPKGTVIQLDILSTVDLSKANNSEMYIGMFKKSYGFGKIKVIVP